MGRCSCPFNSLSRDHVYGYNFVSFVREQIFQLPLSGSRGSRVMVGQGGSYQASFNSLSRDHMQYVPYAMAGLLFGLSTPSLGITSVVARQIDNLAAIPFNSLSRDHFPDFHDHLYLRLAFNSLSRDHRLRFPHRWPRSVFLSTPSLGITGDRERSSDLHGFTCFQLPLSGSRN